MNPNLMVPSGFLGRHRVLGQLGQGGMADVFLAVAPGPVGLNKLVVVKRLRDNRQDEEFLDMFVNEAHIAARLNHPNVIHLYEASHHEAQLFLVMEYLSGQPLQRIRGQLSQEDLPLGLHLRILSDSLLGLHYAHELADYDGTPLGIVHRDMSPQNLFVTYDGTTKVLDFGIAKALNQTVHTRIGGIKGKIQYMSPEQAHGAGHTVDRRSDLFTMGVLLWEAAVGRRLWKGENEVIVFQRLVRGDPIASPRSVNPDVPPQLEHICMRALEVDPKGRYATAEEMRAELEAFLWGAGHHATAKDVGIFLSDKFSRERESQGAMIDAALKCGPTSVTSGSLDAKASSLSGTDYPSQLTRPSTVLTTELASHAIPFGISSLWKKPARFWHGIVIGGAVALVGVLGFWVLSREPRGAGGSPVAREARPARTADSSLSGVAGDGSGAPSISAAEARPSLSGPAVGARPGATEHSDGGAGSPRVAGVREISGKDRGASLPSATRPTVSRWTAPQRPVQGAASSSPNPSRPGPTKRPSTVSIDTENPW